MARDRTSYRGIEFKYQLWKYPRPTKKGTSFKCQACGKRTVVKRGLFPKDCPSCGEGCQSYYWKNRITAVMEYEKSEAKYRGLDLKFTVAFE